MRECEVSPDHDIAREMARTVPSSLEVRSWLAMACLQGLLAGGYLRDRATDDERERLDDEALLRERALRLADGMIRDLAAAGPFDPKGGA